MTTSEAIHILRQYLNYGSDFLSAPYTEDEYHKAVELAIKALESQQSSEIVPIGTKVRVLVINTVFDAGDIVEIIGYDIEPPEYKCSDHKMYWWLSREEFELV